MPARLVINKGNVRRKHANGIWFPDLPLFFAMMQLFLYFFLLKLDEEELGGGGEMGWGVDESNK